MKKLQAIYKAAIRAVFGHEYMVWHQNADGTLDVFHCCTLQDAMEWVQCALNCSKVVIMDRSGYLVCQRNPIV